MARPSSAGGRDAPGPRPLHGQPEGGGRATAAAGGTYQVYEGQKFPAASIGLMRGHVNGLVIAQDGAIGQEDGGAQHLAGHQRHVCGAGSASVCLCLCPRVCPVSVCPRVRVSRRVCVCIPGVCARRAGGTRSAPAARPGRSGAQGPRCGGGGGAGGPRAGRVSGPGASRASAPPPGRAGPEEAVPLPGERRDAGCEHELIAEPGCPPVFKRELRRASNWAL